MKTTWWSGERFNLWWFNTWAANSSGTLQLWVWVCAGCYFILLAGGFSSLRRAVESCGWLQERRAASRDAAVVTFWSRLATETIMDSILRPSAYFTVLHVSSFPVLMDLLSISISPAFISPSSSCYRFLVENIWRSPQISMRFDTIWNPFFKTNLPFFNFLSTSQLFISFLRFLEAHKNPLFH